MEVSGQLLPGESQSHVTTDGQSVSPSRCRAPSGAHDQILFDSYCFVDVGRPPQAIGHVCHLSYSPELLQFSSVNLLLGLASYLYSPGAGATTVLCRRLGGPQSRTGLCEEVKNSFNLWSLVVNIYTICFNTLKLCILPTECICVFRMVLTINSDCFPKQH
jgi:hypothetical protein